MKTATMIPDPAPPAALPSTKKIISMDLMNRDQIIKDMLNLLDTISKSGSSCAFALNGPWGAGKSFILDKLAGDLKTSPRDEQYVVFHYNCWQYDYYEEPLIAIITAIMDCLDAQPKPIQKEIRDKFVKALNKLSSFLYEKALDAVKSKYGIDLSAIADSLLSAGDDSKQSKDFDHHQSLKSAIESVRTSLGELAQKRSVVIIVDELDRCLPNYAIKVLERLHHLFYDVSKTVVILGIDRTQLEHSIRTIFGGEIAVDKYLRKLINFELSLEDAKYDSGFEKKYSSYFDLADWNKLYGALHTDDGESLRERNSKKQTAFLNALFDALTPREVDQVINRCETIHNIRFPGEVRDPAFLYAELALVVFRDIYGLEKNPLFYDQYDNQFTINKMFFEEPLEVEKKLTETTLKFLTSFMGYLKENWKGINAEPGKRATTASDTFTFYSQIGFEEALVWYLNDVFPNRVQSFYFRTPTKPESDQEPTSAQDYRMTNLTDLKKFDELRRIIR